MGYIPGLGLLSIARKYVCLSGAAFIGGTGLSGQAVSAWGLDVIVGWQAMLLGAAAGAARLVPELRHARTAAACARRPAGCACCCCRGFDGWYWWPPSSWAAMLCTMPLQ